jgi:hypothetical protein
MNPDTKSKERAREVATYLRTHCAVTSSKILKRIYTNKMIRQSIFVEWLKKGKPTSSKK